MTSRRSWKTPREISSPGELADVIRSVTEAVRAGDLRAVTPSNTPFGAAVDIQQIAPEGPWPDYLELHFEDTQTGECFRLVAETYHGAGGFWDLADEPPT